MTDYILDEKLAYRKVKNPLEQALEYAVRTNAHGAAISYHALRPRGTYPKRHMIVWVMPRAHTRIEGLAGDVITEKVLPCAIFGVNAKLIRNDAADYISRGALELRMPSRAEARDYLLPGSYVPASNLHWALAHLHNEYVHKTRPDGYRAIGAILYRARPAQEVPGSKTSGWRRTQCIAIPESSPQVNHVTNRTSLTSSTCWPKIDRFQLHDSTHIPAGVMATVDEYRYFDASAFHGWHPAYKLDTRSAQPRPAWEIDGQEPDAEEYV